MAPTASSTPGADYVLHQPRALTFPGLVGAGSVAVAGLIGGLLWRHPAVAVPLAAVCLLAGGAYVALSLTIKRFTALDRRLKDRDRLLDTIEWSGSEKVLDVGCGNGILTMGAAKRLTSGEAVGIDIWTEGSGDCRPEAFAANAIAEGVEQRVRLANEDVRQLPYADASFDVIISALTMHHLSRDSRRALEEMLRVLRPGGQVSIYDAPPAVGQVARLLQQAGLDVTRLNPDLVVARKPAASA